MAFSVDAWGPPPVVPVQPVPNLACVQPLGAKPQLTPAQDIEAIHVNWLPTLVPPVFR